MSNTAVNVEYQIDFIGSFLLTGNDEYESMPIKAYMI